MNQHITLIHYEWLGSLSGLLGAFLLATNTGVSGYGFVAFLVSNACWLVVGARRAMWGLLWMQLGFTATTALGLYRWLA